MSSSYAQCDVTQISTNPIDGQAVNDQYINLIVEPLDGVNLNYTNNSYLNTGFNWYPGNQITIDNLIDDGWTIPWGSSINQIKMVNPFTINMPSEYSYLRDGASNKLTEYRWEDGWELMYMNIGKFPNGDSISKPSEGTFYHDYGNSTIGESYTPLVSPPGLPFFVLYNRYTGLLRFFGSLWVEDYYTFENYEVRLTMLNGVSNDVNGMFRHAESIDLALDQETNVLSIRVPKVKPTNLNQWFVAEFQMGYDPCVCTNNTGEMDFEILAIDSMYVNISGRSIAITDQIDPNNYMQDDFLNFTGNQDAGSRIYPYMNNLYEEYETNLDIYNQQMNDYNAQQNNLVRSTVGQMKKLAVDGVLSIIPGGAIAEFAIESAAQLGLSKVINDTNDLKKAIEKGSKNLLGKGYDFLSAQIFGQDVNKPVPPIVPSATFEESSFSGSIVSTSSINTPPMYVPGSFPGNNQSPNLTGLGPHNFPAYNKPVGLFAVLETPNLLANYVEISASDSEYISDIKVEGTDGENHVWYKGTVHKKRNFKKQFYYKIDDAIKYVINEHLDFDPDKSSYYAQLEVEYFNNLDSSVIVKFDSINYHMEQYGDFISNMGISNHFPEQTVNGNTIGQVLIYNSNWTPLNNLHQMTFSTQMDIDIDYKDRYVCFMDSITNPHSTCGLINNMSMSQLEAVFDLNVSKVKLKIMADMYFDQIGSNEKQVNTTQVFTHLLYDINREENYVQLVDHFSENTMYYPGTTILDNEYMDPNNDKVWWQNGNTLYVYSEDIIIKGDLHVAPGYELVLVAQNSVETNGNADIYSEPITIETNSNFWGTDDGHPATSDEVSLFCSNRDLYKAYQPSEIARKTGDTVSVDSNETIPNDENDLLLKPEVSIYPNPANEYVDVLIQNSSHNTVYVKLYTIQGGVLLDKKVSGELSSQFRVIMNNIPPGTYILHLVTDNGNQFSEKVILSNR